MNVFISSTYQDLQDYRREATKAVLDAGMEPILLEAMGAGNEMAHTINYAIEDADIFLIILGFRIGTIPEKGGKSWVEYEYERARENKKPILTFMLSDNAQIRASEAERDLGRVLDFRNKLKSTFLVQHFSTPSDIYRIVLAALLKLKERDNVKSIENQEIKNKDKEENVEIKNVRILRLLLSSPGDVNAERELVSKAIFRFNQEYLLEKGIFIKLIRWEDMAPQIANGPQEVVNRQLANFDIFLGIMWNRFGTPTDLAASGTEEEFNDALASWNENKRPWITFYFCNRPVNFTTAEQLEQKNKVLQFKQKVMSYGIIRPYELLEEFENMVFNDLIKIIALYIKQWWILMNSTFPHHFNI